MLPDNRSDFNDFLNEYQNRRNLQDNQTARNIFDFMNELHSILKMIEYSELEKAAIFPLVDDISNMFDNEFPLNDYNKQSIGSMAATILRPFGYAKTSKASRINKSGFTSGAIFKQTEKPMIKIVQSLSIEQC